MSGGNGAWPHFTEAGPHPNAQDWAPKPDPVFDPWATSLLPEFPTGVLSPEMERLAFGFHLRDGVDIGAQAMALIAAISGAVHKMSRLVPFADSDWSVPGILWIALIADSGQKKTSILENAVKRIRQVHGSVWAAYNQQRAWWNSLSKAEQKNQQRPAEPISYFVDDVTPEKLQMILALQDRGVIMIKDELAGLIDAFGRYTGSAAPERTFFLRAYEGDTYYVSRVTRDSLIINNTAVPILGTIQPDRLQAIKDLDSDGFIQRILPIIVGPSEISKASTDFDVGARAYFDGKIETLARATSWMRYTTTPEGEGLIRHTEIRGAELASCTDYGPGWQGWCSKLHGTHARFALLLHVFDNHECASIPTDTVQRAYRLTHEYVLRMAYHFFSSLMGSAGKKVQDIAGWLLTRDDQIDRAERITARDLQRNVACCRQMKTMKDLNELIEPLVLGDWLAPESKFQVTNKAWSFDVTIRARMAEKTEAERQRRAEIKVALSGIA